MEAKTKTKTKTKRKRRLALVFEKKLWQKGYSSVCGIDEAGRGPLAGPVTAAAVIVKNGADSGILSSFGVNDSKKLTGEQREAAYEKLIKSPLIDWAVATVSEKTIDKINIKNAAEKAMFLAVKKLKLKPDFLIIDGNQLKNKQLKKFPCQLIVKADQKVFSVAAASIIAKVSRDRLMLKYDKKYPRYWFGNHKGYPTRLHLKLLKKHGPCKIHRQSFAPVKNKFVKL